MSAGIGMHLFVGFVVAAMVLFAIGSAVREIGIYRRSVRGELNYLVSKQRRNRRLMVSFLLLLEAVLLFLGIFVFSLHEPLKALLYWTPPLFLIGLLVYLSILDFRETSRDVDRIFKEASETILKKVDRQQQN